MCDGLEREYFRRKSIVHKEGSSFPAVNIDGDRIRKQYGLHEGSDVTGNYFNDKESKKISNIADVRIYDIKDYSSNRNQLTNRALDDVEKVKEKLDRRRRSLVLGSTLPKLVKKTPNSLLEQSQAYRGLRKQISSRLSKSTVKSRNVGRDKNTNISRSQKDSSGIESCAIPTSTPTVFLRTRGIHVRVTETPKEAISKQLPQKNSIDVVSKDNSAGIKQHFNDSKKLLITGVIPTNVPEEENRRSEISSYAIRQQYGQHLEKNWFKSLIREMNCKNKDGVEQNEYPFTPEMFYSPEPESGDDMDDANDDIKSIYENMSSEMRDSFTDLIRDNPCGHNKSHNLKTESAKFASMDVMVSDGESGDDYDIELVLKDGQLIERQVKDKMYKKRERQLVRFQQFFKNAEEMSEEEDELNIQTMSDKELRAMRLKLKKPKWKLKLKGIARFRQVVKSILALLYFSKKLKDARRRRHARNKRNKRHRSLGGFDSDEDEYARYQRQLNKYKSLKERFLAEIGWQLVDDVANLAIRDGFGYDIRDELASGERRSRYRRIIDEWFSVEGRAFEESVKTTVPKSMKLKRSSSCPELIKGKEFRVLFPDATNKKSGTKDLNKHQKKKKGKSKLQKKRPQGKNNLTKAVPKEEENVIGHHKRERRNSLTDDKNQNNKLDLRDLLKDVYIPAKEIKIQIAERKLRKQKGKKGRFSAGVKRGLYDRPRDAKSIIDADRFKLPEFEFDLPELNAADETEGFMESPNSSVTTKTRGSSSGIYSSFSIRTCPFVGTGVSWNQTKSKPKEVWTNEELDRQIEKAGCLFLEMRHCRYIRWNGLAQAMIDRMIELENQTL
ncbi:hypothetical protein SNE40_020093 [Patella caerulea]|uniref:Core-binding (CB) domain-containing protein n=1 Tax=Patella caerulea TaxID=87958 RepID=A0AAN8G9T6_PATCE